MWCSPGAGFAPKFDFACQRSAVPLSRGTSVVRDYLATLFAGDENEVFPYGVDPAFLRSSESLYKPELQGREGWYYNTSDPAQVPPTTNAPYGFFHRPLKVSLDGCTAVQYMRTVQLQVCLAGSNAGTRPAEWQLSREPHASCGVDIPQVRMCPALLQAKHRALV
jgi:hypothetical protein